MKGSQQSVQVTLQTIVWQTSPKIGRVLIETVCGIRKGTESADVWETWMCNSSHNLLDHIKFAKSHIFKEHLMCDKNLSGPECSLLSNLLSLIINRSRERDIWTVQMACFCIEPLSIQKFSVQYSTCARHLVHSEQDTEGFIFVYTTFGGVIVLNTHSVFSPLSSPTLGGVVQTGFLWI